MLNSTPCLRVARGGVKRPCKRERAFFLRKSSSRNEQQKRQIEQRAMRVSLVLLSCCPAVLLVLLSCSSCLLHSSCCPACFVLLPCRLACHTVLPASLALPSFCPPYVPSCVACPPRIARQVTCGVHVCPCMSFFTARHGKREKRQAVTKCLRFRAVNRP